MRTLLAFALLIGCSSAGPTAAPGDDRPVRVYTAHTRRDVSEIASARWRDGYRVAAIVPMADGSFMLVLERR